MIPQSLTIVAGLITVKIRNGALGLSDFVSIFWKAYLQEGLIFGKSIGMFYGPIWFRKLFFWVGPICGGGRMCGGLIQGERKYVS